jgi:2-iminobutanoate/2-iminopropanoate deaminase
MKKRIIQTNQAPTAIGPYSQAIRIGDFIYTSGQISLDAQSEKFISGEIEEETERTIKNISAILQADGLSLDNVIKTTVYLLDLDHFSRMNHVYENYFGENKPARACVQVAALPKGAKIEIDAIASIYSQY